MQQLISKVLNQINSIVIGKEQEVKLSLACLLAKGHILIEDLPGMGKTTLAQVLATTMGLSYQRSQFTSDLLPADVIGVSILNPQTHTFELHKGPIFNQVVLADEINRASPKTQSALLEAMEERQVSIDGVTYELPNPFFVIATQNPLFHAGTYPLPESQLDRFMMRLTLGFPDRDAEKRILRDEVGRQSAPSETLVNESQLAQLQEAAAQVTASDSLLDYVVELLQQSRIDEAQVNPLSPRAGKALLAAAKAWAFMDERDYLLPEDIQAVFVAVAEHRLDTGFTQSESREASPAATLLARVDPTKDYS